VEHRRAVAVDPLDIACAKVRQAELPAGKRDDDLTRMEVSGEDEVERVRREPPDDAREVAEEHAQAHLGICELLRLRLSEDVGLRVHADELHAAAAELDLDRLVAEHRDTVESRNRSRIYSLGKRVARVGEVVVAEDDDARAELLEQPLEERHARAPRDEVAGNTDEIRAALRDPGHRILGRPPSARGDPEMEVREVGDTEAVELGWDAVDLDFEHALPEPPRLKPAPGERPDTCECRDRNEDRQHDPPTLAAKGHSSRQVRGSEVDGVERRCHAQRCDVSGAGVVDCTDRSTWDRRAAVTTHEPEPNADPGVAGGPTHWVEQIRNSRWGQYITERERRMLLAALARSHPGTALDVGCGSGAWSAVLHGLGWDLVCTDVDAASLAHCQAQLPDARCIQVPPDDETLPVASGEVQLLLVFEVNEVVESEWFVREAARVLSPGGTLICTYWNRTSLRGAAYRVAAKMRPNQVERGVRRFQDFYRGPTYRAFRKELQTHGFELRHEEGICWFPFTRQSDSRLIPAAVVVERALGLRRLPTLSPWVLCAAELENSDSA